MKASRSFPLIKICGPCTSVLVGRLTKMAFVHGPAKPPRAVQRQQVRHGTGRITSSPPQQSPQSLRPFQACRGHGPDPKQQHEHHQERGICRAQSFRRRGAVAEEGAVVEEVVEKDEETRVMRASVWVALTEVAAEEEGDVSLFVFFLHFFYILHKIYHWW